MKKVLFLTIIAAFIFLPHLSKAQDVLGESRSFNVESEYDLSKRSQLTATLIKISPTAYWYLDNDQDQEEIKQSLGILGEEFEEKIYPTLTRIFGSEWTPGVDKDSRITILIHPMEKEAGGYTDTADEYPRAQVPESNEREMVYLNSRHINTNYARAFLAHELLHLITFNQKNRTYGVEEEVWLNEARAEYAPTLLGYDTEYKETNLQRRKEAFLGRPSDSLTEWRGDPSDYGVINLFIQYLVDHYGTDILANSLKMQKTGIQSINAALAQKGYRMDFAQIFADWTLAVLINDCQISEKYCYNNPNLKDFRVTPLMNYLPFAGQTTLSVTNNTKDWAGNWHKFIGGTGTLKLEFIGNEKANFKVPYIIEDSEGNLSIETLQLDENLKGEIFIDDFGSKYLSLTIIPIARNKISNFSEIEPSRTFFWSVSTKESEPLPALTPLKKPISQMTKGELLARIAEIQSVISQLQAHLAELVGIQASCVQINQNLYFGLKDNYQVRCLQEFLKTQGSEIYPEGLVTGNFFTLTEKAVIRFQEKYAQDILTPVGLERGTGYVGPSTRAKINQLLAD